MVNMKSSSPTVGVLSNASNPLMQAGRSHQVHDGQAQIERWKMLVVVGTDEKLKCCLEVEDKEGKKTKKTKTTSQRHLGFVLSAKK